MVRASDLRSSGRGFDTAIGLPRSTSTQPSVIHPYGVGKSSTGLVGWGYSVFTCVGWQVTLCSV